MNERKKWTMYQIIAFIIFIIGYLLIHQYMDHLKVKPNEIGNLFMLGVLFYVPVSWLYITIYFQLKKYPKLLNHKILDRLPALIILAGIISIIAFIMLVTMGPFMEWMEQGNWIFYLLLTYAAAFYFLFIMSVVYKISETKNNLIHYSYIWSLAVIFVFSILL